MKKTYKIEIVSESGFSTILLGHGRIPQDKLESVLNKHGADEWELSFMVVEKRRYLIFWTRETVILTFSKNI